MERKIYIKSFIGTVLLVGGFTLRDLRAGEDFDLMLRLQFFTVAFLLSIFIQWTLIPYDWDKHKNKNKEKKDLS